MTALAGVGSGATTESHEDNSLSSWEALPEYQELAWLARLTDILLTGGTGSMLLSSKTVWQTFPPDCWIGSRRPKNRSWRSRCIISSAWWEIVCLLLLFGWVKQESEIWNNQYITSESGLKCLFHLNLNSLLYFNGKFVLLSHSFLFSCFMFFLNLIREARQKGSGSGEGQSTLSIRDSCSSSLSDKALHCTATLHTRTVQYHNTEIRHYLYFPNQHHHQPKSLFHAGVGVPLPNISVWQYSGLGQYNNGQF